MASTEAKINYFVRKMGRILTKEKGFPFILYFNFNGLIRPRAEILMERKIPINLEEMLPINDEEFLTKYDISKEVRARV